jgi:heptosyltransferase-2
MSEAIIVIGLNWLGDVVMSLPAISAACNAGKEVHVVTRPHLADVYWLSDLPVVVHSIATNDNPLKVIKAMKPLSRIFAGAAVSLPDSFRAAVLARLCQTGNAIGFDVQARGLFLNKRVKKPADFKLMHESKLHYMLMREAIPELPEETPELPHCYISKEDWDKTAAKYNINTEKEFVILAPGAAFGAAKRWPPEYFAELTALISKKFPDYQIIITGGKNETEITQQIAEKSGVSVIDLCGKTNLEELACFLSRAKAMVANDSGTMHLAALYRTPTVVPVGPTDMKRTGALNENFVPVIASNCEKIPCRERVCPLKTDACMKSLKPPLVFHFLKEQLDGVGQ